MLIGPASMTWLIDQGFATAVGPHSNRQNIPGGRGLAFRTRRRFAESRSVQTIELECKRRRFVFFAKKEKKKLVDMFESDPRWSSWWTLKDGDHENEESIARISTKLGWGLHAALGEIQGLDSDLEKGGLVLDVVERVLRLHALEKHGGESEYDGWHDGENGVGVRGAHILRLLVLRRHHLDKSIESIPVRSKANQKNDNALKKNKKMKWNKVNNTCK